MQDKIKVLTDAKKMADIAKEFAKMYMDFGSEFRLIGVSIDLTDTGEPSVVVHVSGLCVLKDALGENFSTVEETYWEGFKADIIANGVRYFQYFDPEIPGYDEIKNIYERKFKKCR